MIRIETCRQLAQGTIKTVYQHPDFEDKVIKTMRPEAIAADGGFIKHSAFRRRFFQGVYRQFRREILQYLQLVKTTYGRQQFRFPVETPYGLIGTSEGLGLVTEKVVAPDGKCWTLHDLALGPGLEQKHYEALDRFFEDCIRLHIVFGEVNSAGLMYTEARSGKPEFVLVDGIGEKLLIPVRAMSGRINTRNILKIQGRMMDWLAQTQPA